MPGFREIIERVPGLRQTGAEPADRARAGSRLYAIDRRPYRRALPGRVHLGQAQRIGLIVADPFPAELAALLDDFRVMVAHLAVQRGASADAVAAQYLHQPPDA